MATATAPTETEIRATARESILVDMEREIARAIRKAFRRLDAIEPDAPRGKVAAS